MWQIAMVASVAAGFIHLVFAPEHLAESWVLGVGFLAAAVFQFGWAAWAFVARDPRVAVVGIVGNSAFIAVWAISRSVGLPFGEDAWVPEAIGRPDLICIAFEAVIVALVAVASSHSVRRLRSGPALSLASTLVIPAIGIIMIATVVALAGDSAADPQHPMGWILDLAIRRT
jgi:hypothetical protein